MDYEKSKSQDNDSEKDCYDNAPTPKKIHHKKRIRKNNDRSHDRKITQYFKHQSRPEQTIVKLSTKNEEYQRQYELLQNKLQILQENQQQLQSFLQEEQRIQQQLKESIKSFKKRSKLLINQSLNLIYQQKRKQRTQIYSGILFFRIDTKTYQYGPQILKSENKIKQLSNTIRRSRQINQKSYQIEIMQKLLQSQKQNMKNLIKIAENYKEKIKLANQQKNCKMAQQNWPLIQKRYQILELLGKGGFSQVYKCYDLDSHKLMALKLSSMSLNNPLQKKNQYLRHIQREAQTHQMLEHPNIVKLQKIFQLDLDTLAVVMQYCEGPQLSKYLKEKKLLQQQEAKYIVKSLLEALQYLNQRPTKIIHYDLKPQNIMFHEGKVKILDFGLCKLMETQQTQIALTSQGAGTYWYLPPQAFKEHQPTISSKVDIWSVGVIFFQMLYGKRPFGHNSSQIKILKERTILKAHKVQFPLIPYVSEQCKQFISQCLKYNPDQRLDASQALKGPYFSNEQKYKIISMI